MGFCFFNNIAVGAAHALEEHGLKRVAIIDFDVHFGNGTVDIITDDRA
jgi:acetoin utilization deacetylase AcuC-like enzyme